jgi:hypothetical protein
MALYEDRYFSLVKFCKTLAAEAANTFGTLTPAFVNFDAHANISDLPKTDIIGLLGYSIHMNDKMPTIFVGVYISTFNDPDLVRHMKLVGLVFSKLQSEDTIPLYSAAAPTVQSGFMVVANGTTLEPCAKVEVRSLQLLNVRLLSESTVES